LAGHPDCKFANYVINVLRSGFRIDYDYSSIRRYANKKYKVCNGMAHIESLPGLTLAPLKSHPGKWRIILDLSSPHGLSVNDGINKELRYMSR